MKNMFKRNQIMITALAIMIAVAGDLNFAGTRIGEEEMVSAGAEALQALPSSVRLSYSIRPRSLRFSDNPG